MQELMKFIKTLERFKGKIDCTSTLAKILKSDGSLLYDFCEAVLNAIDDYNHIKQFFK